MTEHGVNLGLGWLVTWPKIARYCNRSVKTVKRYEKKFGMVVYRLPGNIPAVPPAILDLWLREYTKAKNKQMEQIKAQAKQENE